VAARLHGTGPELDARVVRTLALAAVAAVLLTGCSTAEDPAPTTADVAGAGWSPCDELTAAQVGAIAGAGLRMRTGTEESPICRFVPKAEGGPIYDVSYLFFDGGLDTALDAMGTVGTQLTSVDVPGAEAARLAVRERRSGIAVTGFVQTDGLVQSVNAVHLNPYDRDAMVSSTTELMALLVENAPQG
jgi:hypothetical protein